MSPPRAAQAQAQNLSFTPTPGGILQRACACGQHTGAGGECAECRKRREAGSLQRAVTSADRVNDVPPIVYEVLRSPGQPLDAETRAFMEPRFGYDFSGVQVHTDGRAAVSAQAINARAYTVGRDVVFATGEYAPGTSLGNKLLAHELAHVVQQTLGAQPPTQRLTVDLSTTTESAADNVAMAALRGATLPSALPASPRVARQAKVSQKLERDMMLAMLTPLKALDRTTLADLRTRLEHDKTMNPLFELAIDVIWTQRYTSSPLEIYENVLKPRMQLIIPRDKNQGMWDAIEAQFRMRETPTGYRPTAEDKLPQTDDVVFFDGFELVIKAGGKVVKRTLAVSGKDPEILETEKGAGPIPDGSYKLSPQVTNKPITSVQVGKYGANPIGSGYQEILTRELVPCADPTHPICTIGCPDYGPDERCHLVSDVWGNRRIRIEGTKLGRDGFYIHGGIGNYTATSGCIKIFDDQTFELIRAKFKKSVQLIVQKTPPKK